MIDRFRGNEVKPVQTDTPASPRGLRAATGAYHVLTEDGTSSPISSVCNGNVATSTYKRSVDIEQAAVPRTHSV